jgi:hypothetical protein
MNNYATVDEHAFEVLFSRVVYKGSDGFKSAGIDGSLKQ